MSVMASTGLRNYLLQTGPLRTALNLGFLKLYSGTPPATADAALGSAGTNTLLCTISNNGTATGLTWEATASAGTIAKTTSEVWAGTNAATGLATFYRFVAPGDTGVSSTTEMRLQGTISTIGADLNMASPSLVISAGQVINTFVASIPAS